MNGSPDLDVVVYGATGFVGELTAKYLAEHAPEGARIGLGGRSQDKLERVRSQLGPRAADWPLLVADSSDRAALDALVRRTTAVATTVGPYAQYGIDLVEACADHGTHYCDLTGEVLFMRETIDRFDARAKESGARIVHTCGFDSIPSDLGVLLISEAAGDDDPLEEATLVVRAMRGGVSGGTLASMMGQLDAMRADPAKRRLAEDPYALSPDRAAEAEKGEPDFTSVTHDDELGTWLAPFVMGMINTRVVRRSNALLGHAYGRELRYRETMATGDGIAGRVKALGVAGGLGALIAGASFGPTRAVLDRVLPSPGQGPSEKARENGFFKIETRARTKSGRRIVARYTAQGDPGYKATAVMLAESALCLALDADRLPDRAGVLTPASAMGGALVERLRAAGHTLTVD